MLDLLFCATLAGGHVLLEGVPGVAKTLTAKLLAKTLSVGFSRIQFTPDLMPSDVLGTSVFNPKSADFSFRKGPIFSNFILIDEINRAPAKTQAALFEVMEERQATVDGTTYPMSPPFLVVATQNPIEQEGTYRLPEAQLDRFLFKIQVPYPSAKEEAEILLRHHGRALQNPLNTIQSFMTATELAAYQTVVSQIHVEANLFAYIAELISKTRNNPDLYLGASPRASLAVMNGAKSFAALRGRDFITPEDIQTVFLPALRHRIELSPEKEMEGAAADTVLKNLLSKVDVPR
jgi:MoxR-like ATPase